MEKNEMFLALRKVQKKMPIIGKNKQGYKGNYADLEKVWLTIKPLLEATGLLVYHSVEKSGVKTTLLHSSGEKMTSLTPWGKLELTPQERGSEITYYKRYNILALLNIVIADEDNDGHIEDKSLKAEKVNVADASKRLLMTKNLASLKAIWTGLTPEERGNVELQKIKDQLKNKLK